MNEDEMNDAISNACGDRESRHYTADLNAIADARRALMIDVDRRVKFLRALHDIVGRRPEVWCNPDGKPTASDYDLIDATAMEQAEALLKACGLWVKKTEA